MVKLTPPRRVSALAWLLTFVLIAVVLVACTSVRRLDTGPGGPLASPSSPSPTVSIYVPRSPIPGLHRSQSPIPVAPTSPFAPTSPVPNTSPAADSGVVKEGSKGVVPCGRKEVQTSGGVQVTKTWTCFDVTGGTVAALKADAQANGPTVDGQRRIAATKWGLKWSFTTVSNPDGCDIVSPHVTATITYVYPRATNTKPERTIQKWEQFLREDVIPHENTHGSIAVDGGEKMVTALTNARSAPSCQKAKKNADRAAKNVAGATTAKQNEFDDKEAHQ